MSLPVRHLPVVQNWDCHVCGTCCKEYLVTLTEEERRQIEAQGWDKDEEIGDLPILKKTGPWWARRYHLTHRGDGSCIFLTEQGRCRIHERFGYAAKPLPCRLFPFLLVPAGDHWRVGVRFACPSAAANKGRSVTEHEESLRKFAAELAQREGVDLQPGDCVLPAPALQGRQRTDWPDLLRFMHALLTILRNPQDRMERRLRKCTALANLCREARFEEVRGGRLAEFLKITVDSLENEVPADPATLPPPGWLGRLLFRQAVAVFTRKDHGPDCGVARQGRVALLLAAWRFAVGNGAVPRLHNRLPETTFAQIETAAGPLPADAEDVLERYFTIKVESMQFCGPTNFRLPFWEGLEMLLLMGAVIFWVARAMADLPRVEAVQRALTIVDDHFGYNRVLRARRHRVGFSILARSGELQNLIAWYGR
jgi:lysine-N-methylase